MTDGVALDAVSIYVPGLPQGKGRARSRVVHAKGRTFASHYTPAKTRTYEGVIATAASAAMNGRPPMVGPVLLNFVAVVPPPASWPAWKQAAALAGHVSPTTKPDLDNIEKALLDGFNAVVWRDDVQVVAVAKSKGYGQTPGIRAVVSPHPSQAAQDAKRALVPGQLMRDLLAVAL